VAGRAILNMTRNITGLFTLAVGRSVWVQDADDDGWQLDLEGYPWKKGPPGFIADH